MTALASAGYLVVAPNHRDATCDGGGARWIDRPEQRFVKPETWDETSFRDRADDIVHLVAALKAMPEWRNRIDWHCFGLVGHSLGGYTVLGLDGAWPSWKLGGVKAVLALSPYVQPFLVRGTPAGLGAPVMYQGGTLDVGITPALHKAMGAYDLLPMPKYYVELKGAGHFAWTDFAPYLPRPHRRLQYCLPGPLCSRKRRQPVIDPPNICCCHPPLSRGKRASTNSF
jgi:predicted dienelactone hydrolase